MKARQRIIAIHTRNPELRDLLNRYFEGFLDSVEAIDSFDHLLRRVGDSEFDLLVFGFNFDEGDRQNWMAQIASADPALPVIVIADECGARAPLDLMRLGARDVLIMPVTVDDLDRAVRNVFIKEKRRMERNVTRRIRRNFSGRIPSEPESVQGIIREVLHLCEGFVRKDSDREVKIPLLVAETLYNAIEHGNKRSKEKVVAIEASADENEFFLSVTDEGEGFDPAKLSPPIGEEAFVKTSGRGIFMMRIYADSVTWSDEGRTIELRRRWQ